MATTVTAIRSAIETTLAALVPAGTTFGATAYKLAGVRDDWEGRPDASRDRHFTVEDIPPGMAPNIGAHTSDIIETTLSVTIGHMKLGDSDRHKSKGRRDRDLEQIARHLNKSTSFPSDVCAIDFSGVETLEENDKYWWTTLGFRLLYLGAV